ncbi:MAG: cupin domain-containing protein [Gammaproteobacteria bacterium]|nr:cupin domain-containing protein [Gammaproteobacteria bacterium]
MARMILTGGGNVTDLTALQERLGGIGIALRRWPVPDAPRVRTLLEKAALDEPEKEQLLAAVDDRFQTLKREAGYSTRDLIVIHENIPGLADMLGKFDKVHLHTDDEVRYILAGKGYFGFVEPDGGQFMVEVNAGDYINVPANAEHWFTLGDSKRIKAVRYFIDTRGWTPVYTGRAMLFG